MGKTGMWGHLILILIMNSTGYSSKLSLVLKCVIPYTYKPVSISSVTMKNFGYYMAMAVVQFAYGGSNILIKIALERGLNQFVYRHILAMLLLAPQSICLPTYTSPTVATARSNVIPSLTFPMAVFLRMEKVKIRSGSGGAKASGTFLERRRGH
ncbi:Nodulin MtN21/EamA-like transporter family protein isoform 3 [Gossypium australe]|uniref:Nodulin MtN21/EamA-like transporter family protein isoform 3 n=1 Tax=Gossypium australe TaxID=47621 RepID=A0A5B6VM71_9ROSI|nr:Nodulin MtN21/EamA-like transporter family protein isoform 3 [Gossypium australe]